MTEGKQSTAAFLEGLARQVKRDEEDPGLWITDGNIMRPGDDGQTYEEMHSGEAILILRGEREGRMRALRRLLADLQ